MSFYQYIRGNDIPDNVYLEIIIISHKIFVIKFFIMLTINSRRLNIVILLQTQMTLAYRADTNHTNNRQNRQKDSWLFIETTGPESI